MLQNGIFAGPLLIQTARVMATAASASAKKAATLPESLRFPEKLNQQIFDSPLVSRDLSWLQFNHRVLDQAKDTRRSLIDRLKFLAITSSNLDEFFMIRVGSLYNYIDYGKERVDYSGLREDPFRLKLFGEVQAFVQEQVRLFQEELQPQFAQVGFRIVHPEALSAEGQQKARDYFDKTIFPMLTPMAYDAYRAFPILMNKLRIFGVVTREEQEDQEQRKLSFVQVPANLPRFYVLEQEDEVLFVPVEELIRRHMRQLFRNVDILSTNLFRITRNGDFTLEETDDMDVNFIEEVTRKLKTRRTGRVVRIEVEGEASEWMLRQLKNRWELDELNIFECPALLDYTGLWQIVKHPNFRGMLPAQRPPVVPATLPEERSDNIFQQIKRNDIFLHHPYHSFEPVLELVEAAAEDSKVLAIKMTIYRLAEDSRIATALLRAAENGKHVSVLFEVKARFDEENNIREARKLQNAGCFVIYGVSNLKTHTKMLQVVRKERDRVYRYNHLGSGNYNEDTARLYTDVGLLTADEAYGQDISEFFNAITGHSNPRRYDSLLTAPHNMRERLIELTDQEAENARKGLSSGIIIKVNSLQDKELIEALYAASQAGVPIQLIVRGICSVRPGRVGLSENITVRSIVGDFLEHSRIFYFQNNSSPKVYAGSADAMVRSFDRRIESLFLIRDERCLKEALNILLYNLRDDANSYIMAEDASYQKVEPQGERPFNLHEEFYNVRSEMLDSVQVY